MNQKDNQGLVANSLFNLLSGTFFSRFTGMLREIVMATYFGADPLVAAFWLAFRTIFFLRKILGGPILGLAFIPHFEFLRAQDPNRAAFFFRSFSKFFCYNACIFTFVIEIGLAIWMHYAKGGVVDALQLTMILLPSGIFLMMYTVNSTLLHCEKKFLSVGLAPSIVNILWIATVFLGRNSDSRARIIVLCIVLVIGFIFEWLATVPGVKSFLGVATTRPKEHDSIKALIAPLSLGLLSMGVYQINLLCDMCLARYINDVGPLYLMYSIRIQQLPVHLFGLGVFTVLLPAISRCVQQEDHKQGYDLMKFALNLTVSVMVIMTSGLLLLALPGVRLLYEHGLFPTTAVHAIVEVLRGYSSSIIPMALAPLVSVLFYARRHYTIPLVIGMVSAVANIFLNILFGCWIVKNVSGLAYATSIVSWGQLYLLWLYAGKHHPTYRGLMWITFKRSIKVVATTALAFAVTLGVNVVTHTTYIIFLNPFTSLSWSLSSFTAQSAAFFSESGIFLAFLFGFAKLLRVEDLVNLTSFQYWRGHRDFLHSSQFMQE
ncbi:mviN-like family protein [Chlamydia ibidis]|uniref:MviN-like family protein n=2 Tax=Chlamydia ibidis TaxID=1405396 RepID=S7J380_9CHLA|nr:murein biosynthesis integral membrane protein MurJ [Chlamydia ibidis]EPP34668.1 mviN-like family protein [Chlamydia ibidis]EQM62823.1 mviN-like family protein [Chlamydia ibidis 10-1398/6]